MHFVLKKEWKFSNFYNIIISTFNLVNILNNSCRLGKIK